MRGTESSPPQTEATAQRLLSVSLGLNEPRTQTDVCEGYSESLFAIVHTEKNQLSCDDELQNIALMQPERFFNAT